MEELRGVCKIVKVMSEGFCHKTWYKKEKGYKQLFELSNDVILTFFWRAGCKSYLEDGSLVINNFTKVCFYCYCMYLTCFVKKQKNCNNLFDVHAKTRKRKQRRGTHSVRLKSAQKLEGKFCLIPGEKLCRECWMHTKNILHDHNSPTSSSTVYQKMIQNSLNHHLLKII